MKHSIWIALVYAVLSCALVANAHAESENLLTVTGDNTSQTVAVDAIIRDGKLAGMSAVGRSYTLDQLAGGVVLLQKSGYKVLVLQGRIDPQIEVGSFSLRFLKNAVFNSYSACPFFVRHSSAEAPWFVQNAYTGKKVSSIRVITSAVGVQTLENICR